MEGGSSTLPFILPRRSHLRSTTIRTLVRILSHCIDDSSSDSRSQISSEAQRPGTDSNSFQSENSVLANDTVTDGNPKSIHTQNEIFGDGGVVGGESGRREGRQEFEVENLSVEKDPIADGNPKTMGEGSWVDGQLGLITWKEGNAESVDCSKLEIENLSIGTDPVMDENPKLIGTQNETSFGWGLLIDRELGQIMQQEGSGFVACTNNEFENLSMEKDPIADGIPKLICIQNGTSCWESSRVERDLGQITQQERIDEAVNRGKLKPENLSMENDPIMDRSTAPICNQDEGSCLGESFVDRGLGQIVQRGGSNEFVNCNTLEFESLSIEKDPIADGSPKLTDTHCKIFIGGGSPVDWDSVEMMQHKGSDESVNHDKREIENLSIEKFLILDGNPVPINTQDGLICSGGSPVDGGLGQIMRPQGSCESIDCGKLEFEYLSREKGPIADDCPKLTNFKDSDFSDGSSHVGRELRDVMEQVGRDELVACNNLGLKKLLLEKDPLADEAPEVVKLDKETQQQEHDGFIDHNSLECSISSVQKNLIVENICISLDAQVGHNGSEQNAREISRHEMQREGHELNTILPYDTVTNSPRLRNSGEMPITDNVNDAAGLIANQEMEDGEIPVDSEVPMESHDSILDHVVFEDRQEEGEISDGFTKQREDFTHMFKEQLRVGKKDKFLGSDLAGSFVSIENCTGKIINAKKIKGKEDESKKSSRSRTIKVKQALKNDSLQRTKLKEKDNRVKGDATGQLDTSNCLGLPGKVSEKIGTQEHGQISTVKDAKVREKKKRGPMTEGRKAKKKVAKKRKRAEQNRKLGVKRLKLQPILKPKVVSDCIFHLKGKCQQGDKCKFSHDAIPLTKSQPCRYFAHHSCLKGDDCPFDHQLSKYPCCKYMSSGYCSRGDECLFSHQMPITEGVTGTSMVCDPESQLSPYKTNLKKQLNINGTSHLAVNHALKDTSLRTPSPLQSLLHEQPKQHVAELRPKPLTQVPEGIRFLSFGEAPLHDANKKQLDNLPPNTCSGVETCNQQKRTESEKLVKMKEMPCRSQGSSSFSCQDSKSFSCGPKKPLTSARKAHLSMPAFFGKYESDITTKPSVHAPLNADASTILESNSFSSGLATHPIAGKFQSRSTDASRILEEFLFSGNE